MNDNSDVLVYKPKIDDKPRAYLQLQQAIDADDKWVELCLVDSKGSIIDVIGWFNELGFTTCCLQDSALEKINKYNHGLVFDEGRNSLRLGIESGTTFYKYNVIVDTEAC